MEWTQPVLTASVLKDLRLDREDSKNPTKMKATPANSTTILTDFKDDKDHDKKFDYRQVIGKLLDPENPQDLTSLVHCISVLDSVLIQR